MARSLKRGADEHIEELEKTTDKRVTTSIDNNTSTKKGSSTKLRIHGKKQNKKTPAIDKRVTSAVKTSATKVPCQCIYIISYIVYLLIVSLAIFINIIHSPQY